MYFSIRKISFNLLIISVAFFVSFAHTSAFAVDIAGYFEAAVNAEYLDRTTLPRSERSKWIGSSKLRIDLESGGGENELEFTGNIIFIANHQDIFIDLGNYIPEDVHKQLQDEEIPTEVVIDQSRVYLDNAYVTWHHRSFQVRGGRQQLSWGPAYSFNPTDLFHRKDVIDPTYEKEGVTALRVDYRWGIGGQLTGIAVPGDNFDRSGYALRVGTHISKIGYDVAITLHQVQDETTISLEDEEFPVTNISQRRQAVGVDFSGGLFGLGVWLEGNYNMMSKENDFSRAVFGVDYTLQSGLNMMVEGLYNGRGTSVPPYTSEEWLASLYHGEPIGRTRILAGVRKGITGLTEVGMYVFGSEDGSVVLNPRIDISIAQNADLVLFGALTAGNNDGQFQPGIYSITTRVRVYF